MHARLSDICAATSLRPPVQRKRASDEGDRRNERGYYPNRLRHRQLSIERFVPPVT
jgi:hypothetical protein